MAYLANPLLGETESGYQHQSTDSPRRIGTVPNLLGLKSPSDIFGSRKASRFLSIRLPPNRLMPS